MTIRKISSAQDLAQAAHDMFNAWADQQGDDNGVALEEFCARWASANLEQPWHWPFQCVAANQFADTDIWIKQTIGGN